MYGSGSVLCFIAYTVPVLLLYTGKQTAVFAQRTGVRRAGWTRK